MLYERGELESSLESFSGIAPPHYLDGIVLPEAFAQKVPDFVGQGERWVRTLGADGFAVGATDVSALDKVRDRLGHRSLESSRFTMLVALVGEVMRARRSGIHWELRVPKLRANEIRKATLREAWLVDDRGWKTDVSFLVHEWIKQYPSSIEQAIDEALKTRTRENRTVKTVKISDTDRTTPKKPQ
jgi:hypothetical protein